MDTCLPGRKTNFPNYWPFLLYMLFGSILAEQNSNSDPSQTVSQGRQASLLPFGKERQLAADQVPALPKNFFPATNSAAVSGKVSITYHGPPPSESNMDFSQQNERSGQAHVPPGVSFRKLKRVEQVLQNKTRDYELLMKKNSTGGSRVPDLSDYSVVEQIAKLISGTDEPENVKANETKVEPKLSTAESKLQELLALLNTTIEERTNAQQYGRIMENSYSALKLENDMLVRSFNEEHLKNRRLRDQLVDTQASLAIATANTSGNGSIDAANKPWDLNETVYSGDGWHRNWDGREPPMGPENVTATRVIFFLRHGHYEFSEPEEKIEMTELGKKQMEAVGFALSLLKLRWKKEFVHSSKYRTQQAAEIIAKHIPGLTLVPSALIWSCSYDSDSPRRQVAFKKYIYRAPATQKHISYELIMTHSSIIRYFVERALQVTYGTIALPLIHGSITRLEIPPDGRVILREFGEYSHIPRELLSLSNAKWVPVIPNGVRNPANSTTSKPPAGG